MVRKPPEQGPPPIEFTHEQIKDLLHLVHRLGLEELQIENGSCSLRVVGRRAPVAPAAAPAPVAQAPGGSGETAPALAPAPAEPLTAEEPEEDLSKYKKITSPMIGTFYRSPAPESASFVSVGEEVDPESVLCIIEAMKLMNEIKAETRGIVRRVLVENGQPVEYGQPIFLIEPT